jgi:hypothetical protein
VMNALILGNASSIGGFLARSVIMPVAVCAAIAGVLGGGALLGADLPDGTTHTVLSAP